MTTQVKLSERCFTDCINEFRNKSLTDEEKQCSQKCFQVSFIPGIVVDALLKFNSSPSMSTRSPRVQKYINATQRMALRWSELSQKAAELQNKR